jgi:hypothetical protein
MSRHFETAVIFAGPTLHGVPPGALRSMPFKLLEPAKRGDVDKLVHQHSPGIIVVVDGVFHNHPSIGHREIRIAIEQGWEVWGLASMGAIRACEMRSFGMKGFGEIFERYASDEDFTDDEVALLHEPEPPHEPVSEPLVHIRAVLRATVAEGSMPAACADEIDTKLREVWFGFRTLPRLIQLARERCPESVATLLGKLRNIDAYRIKTLDLIRFLERQPWSAPPHGHDSNSEGAGRSGGRTNANSAGRTHTK